MNLQQKLPKGWDISFSTASTPDFIVLKDFWDIIVKWTLVENDKELVDALREFLKEAKLSK